MQQGGGIGHDFSTLRPKGAPVKSIGADASGPVSFMDVWDAMCRTIMSAGARRGAMMAHAALRPPRHRGLRRRQGRPGAPAQFQPVGAGDGRLHRAPCAAARLGSGVRRQGLPHRRRARPVGPHHARHLRLRRARRGVHRPHQRREQPRLLRDDQRHQSVRRAAPAALRRLPAGLDQSGPSGRQAVHRRRRGSTRRGWRRSRPRPCASSTTPSTSPTIRCRRSGRRPRPSGASASA